MYLPRTCEGRKLCLREVTTVVVTAGRVGENGTCNLRRLLLRGVLSMSVFDSSMRGDSGRHLSVTRDPCKSPEKTGTPKPARGWSCAWPVRTGPAKLLHSDAIRCIEPGAGVVGASHKRDTRRWASARAGPKPPGLDSL